MATVYLNIINILVVLFTHIQYNRIYNMKKKNIYKKKQTKLEEDFYNFYNKYLQPNNNNHI